MSVDHLARFLRVQSEERTLRVHDAVTNFHFFFLVHERFAKIGIVSVAAGHAADERGKIGNSFIAFRLGQVLSGGENRRGGADGADRRHINMFGGKGNERAGRSGVRIDKSVSGNRDAIECAGDFLGRIEAPSVGVHFNHDRACFGRFRQLDSASQKKVQGRRNFAS